MREIRRECDLLAVRATLCGDRACRVRENAGESAIWGLCAQPSAEIVRVREMQARVRFASCARNSLRGSCVSIATQRLWLTTGSGSQLAGCHCPDGKPALAAIMVEVGKPARWLPSQSLAAIVQMAKPARWLPSYLSQHAGHHHFFSASTDAVWAWCPGHRESLTHKLLTENQKLSCSKHLVSQVSQRPESKTKEKAGKRHAHFSPHT